MNWSYKFWKTTSAWKLIIWYAAGVAFIAIAHYISPTNLAGPGLDMLALLIFLICWLFSFMAAIIKVFEKDNKFILPLIIHTSILVSLIIICELARQ